jgi:hypothetical protein
MLSAPSQPRIRNILLTSSSSDVVLLLVLGEIDHVGREKGLAVLLEVGLIGIEHTVEPWQELLRAVIGVEDDGNTVGGGDGADIVGCGDGTGDRGLLVLVVDALS